MNLGDVSEQTIPKMCLVSPPENGGAINTRMFIPHVVHEAIGVLAAVLVATACLIMNDKWLEDLMVSDNSKVNHSTSNIKYSSLSIEHPSGEFTVNLEYEFVENQINILKSGVIRTARVLSKGEVWLPI